MEPLRKRRCILLASPEAAGDPAPIFGLLPVERTVLSFFRAGVREFLVTGKSEDTKAVIHALRMGPCRRTRVRRVDSLPGALKNAESFFLAQTDTHYDRRLIGRFVEETRTAVGTLVAVDFRAGALEAHHDAARVALWNSRPGGTVRMCGSKLVSADGVLAGLALGTPGLARALYENASGAHPLARALNLLAAREPVETWSVGELWQEVGSSENVALARRKVLAGAVGVSDGVVARYLNRPISQRITEHLLSRPVASWQISLLSFAATLAAGLSFAIGHASTGGLLAQTASVLNGVDGELARIRYQDSAFGGVYDALLDRIGDAALIGGMTLYAWLLGAGHSAVALGFAAVAGSSLSMLIKEKYAAQFKRRYASEREGHVQWLLLGRDGRLFLALVAGLTGYVEAVLAYLAVGSHVYAGLRIYRIRAESAAA